MTRTASALAILLVVAALSIADDRRVQVDDKTDFSLFTTFAIAEGRSTSRRPELNNTLTLNTIVDAIRSELSAKGLRQDRERPDLIVNFSLAENPQRGVIGSGKRNAQVISFSVGTLVIEITRRDTKAMIWHGVYTDDESNAAKLARKLPSDAKKLLSDFPKKKK